jgi:hypothetical protein
MIHATSPPKIENFCFLKLMACAWNSLHNAKSQSLPILELAPALSSSVRHSFENLLGSRGNEAQNTLHR